MTTIMITNTIILTFVALCFTLCITGILKDKLVLIGIGVALLATFVGTALGMYYFWDMSLVNELASLVGGFRHTF